MLYIFCYRFHLCPPFFFGLLVLLKMLFLCLCYIVFIFHTLGTFTSLTIQHYYLQAVSRCQFYGTPEDNVYCHQLANICVLQLFSDTSLACNAHKQIIIQRGINTFDSVSNWVTGQPWLFFSGDANKVCTTYAYLRRVNLQLQHQNYVLLAFYMNGTFGGKV